MFNHPKDLDATLVEPALGVIQDKVEKISNYPSLETNDDSSLKDDPEVDELQEDVKPVTVHLAELSDTDDEEGDQHTDADPPAPLSSEHLFSHPVEITSDTYHEDTGSTGKLSVEITVKQTLPNGETIELVRYTNTDGGSLSFTSSATSHALKNLRRRAMELHHNHEKTYRAWKAAREELKWAQSLNTIYRNSEKDKEKIMEEAVIERDKARGERTMALRAKEEAVEKMETALVQRDKARAEKEKAMKETQEAITARKKVEEERVQRFIRHAEETSRRSKEQDKLRKDKEKAMESRESMEKELAEEKRKRQSIFQTHSQWSVDWMAGEKRKSEELQEKDRLIEEKDREIKRLKMDLGLGGGQAPTVSAVDIINHSTEMPNELVNHDKLTRKEGLVPDLTYSGLSGNQEVPLVEAILTSIISTTDTLVERAMEAISAPDTVNNNSSPASDDEADESLS